MEAFSTKKKHDFDLETVQYHFERTLINDDIIVLEHYLQAYKELCRFFKLVGRIFGFVAKDLESKIKAIEYHMNNDKLNYYSVQAMVKFETAHRLTHSKHPHPSGCRTLLRLNHALEFIIAFMKRLRESSDDAKTSTIAWDVYRVTLHNHHPWMTQKLAAIAVYALPSKREVIEIMCKQDYERVSDLLKQVSDVGQDVYNAIHEVLKANDLLCIP